MRGLSSDSAGAPPTLAPLSVILITRNEEANIREWLASVDFASELVVVDCGSTDATVTLARAAGARVLVTPDWPGFGAQKNRALDLATQPWVLSLDADERVTPQLREEILALVRGGAAAHDAFSVPRRSSFCGQYMAHSGWYPDRVVRLFRRGTARFSDDLVHERLVTQGSPGQLRGDLLHATYPDLESMLEKLNRYSSASAESMFRQGQRSSLGGALLRGWWAFFRTYVLRSGWRDGRMGLVLAVSIAEGTYYKYLKLWLLSRAPRKQGL
ncbi:MAG: glycosyltransferase family 2 protein [Comamonadaceae bacterium]|nr:MAG: glycosyltransferase family 2 protein [Comamonadaceae bacterium]